MQMRRVKGDPEKTPPKSDIVRHDSKVQNPVASPPGIEPGFDLICSKRLPIETLKFTVTSCFSAMMPELSDDSMEDDFKNNMTAALRQMLISESHTSLNKLIKDVIVKNLPPASNLTVISHTCLTTVSSSTVLTTPIQPSKATTSTTNSTSESGSTETDNTKPTSEAITSTTNSNTVSSSTTVASNESYHSYRLENREKSPNLIIFDTDTDHSAQVNEIISSLLSKTGEMFSGQKLQPYNLADFEQELYQSKIGAAILEVGLSGLRSLAISGNPDIQMMHTMVMATTDITFTNLKYSAKVVVDSTMSTWMAQGNAENLMGQLMVDVNWTNTSSNAIVVFKGFKLLPFVSEPNAILPQLECSPHTEASRDRFTHVGNMPDDAAGRRVFSAYIRPQCENDLSWRRACARRGWGSPWPMKMLFGTWGRSLVTAIAEGSVTSVQQRGGSTMALKISSLTGNFTTVAPTERDYPDENELMGVVRGAFISKIISKLQDAASEPVKNATSGKVWNIEAALATTQAPTQTPVHGSASPLSPLRAWAFALASSLPAMLAAKMLLDRMFMRVNDSPVPLLPAPWPSRPGSSCLSPYSSYCSLWKLFCTLTPHFIPPEDFEEVPPQQRDTDDSALVCIPIVPAQLQVMQVEFVILNPSLVKFAIINPSLVKFAILNPSLVKFAILNPSLVEFAILNPSLVKFAILNPSLVEFAILNPSLVKFAIINPSLVKFAIINPSLVEFAILNPSLVKFAIINPCPSALA
ncbi:hypothetical protein PR048_027017 [Dryococelus australis]|uniref:Uncharacterized protein n=1 Tax=Dryococelus australis TaxID=614101 RepID=A0ABQ9GMX3_9NEOP|nr:hypothetical protein PR048_027017 [Dryococelus australis]